MFTVEFDHYICFKLVLCWVCSLQIFSPSLGLSFHPLNFSFGKAEAFSFDTSNLSVFPFVCHAFSVKSKNSALPWTLRIFPFLF